MKQHPSSPLKNCGASAHRANMRRTQPANLHIASILRPSSADEDGDGDGPYFDLEFSIPNENDEDDIESTIGSDYDHTIQSDILISTSSKPQLASSLFKSATKFRIFMLRFKKSSKSDDSSSKKPNGKLLVKVEEVFSRDATMQSPALSSDEKKTHPRDVIHKYLNKIKPLYNRASKWHGDKHRFSGQIPAGSGSSLNIVSKRLRKSRSASAAVAAVRSPPAIQQEDGIESAIAHCKRSFNGSKGTDLGLARCRSDPGAERDCD